jgi:putative acetyltransferase
MHIRMSTPQDKSDILKVYMSAFPRSEYELVSELAIRLLANGSISELFAWVVEIEGRVVAHIAFSPVTIENDAALRGYILAPLAVHPDYQKQGIGSALIRKGVQVLTDKGVNILFVYGDPDYYGRFGFRAESAEHYMSAYPLQYPFGWQAVVLNAFIQQDASVNIQCVDALNNSALW